jgi:hypothetical protein
VVVSVATTVIAPEKRDVLFHLTPYAKGCAMASASDRRRKYLVTGRRPGQAIDALLRKLDLSPHQVEASPLSEKESSIHPPGKPEEPFAFVWEGLTLAEVRSAIDNLKPLRAAR